VTTAKTLLFGAAAAAILAQATPGFAEGDEAKAAFENGKALFKQEKFDDAARAFREAYRIKPTWKLHYNIGQCEAAQKHYDLALEAFEAYLAEGGDEVEAARQDEVLAEVQRLRAMVGVVEIQGQKGDAVRVNGQDRGELPDAGRLKVSMGTVKVEVRRASAVVLERELKLSGGETATLVVEASKEKPAATPQPAPVAPPTEATPEPEPEPSAAPTQDKATGLDPVWFWVGLGATAAFGATAVGLDFGVGSKWDEATKSPSDQALKDQGKAMQISEYAFIGLAGAAAITTAVLAGFTDFGGDGESSAASVSAAPWSDGDRAGVAIEGRF
jgi:tetratricopeptide (TPR) repeat protein